MPDDFEDIFGNADDYFKKITKRMFKEMEDIEEAIRSGKLEGEWDIKPIEEPGVKGYIAKGRFQLGDNKQGQTPKTFKMPDQIEDEVREPLTDVFQDKDNVRICMELPSVEKSDILLNITGNQAEVKAKNFLRTVDLPTKDLETDKASANYKNGVLEVVIPKLKKTESKEQKHTIKIE